jgi:uncharacterized protein (DUF983 family)
VAVGKGRVGRILRRGLRLSCPRCGGRPIFRGPFRMLERCPACGLVFEREPGYFVGAIYLNYGVTAVVMLAGYLALDAGLGADVGVQLLVWGSFVVVFPLWFFRYSKSLWLSVDHLVDPVDASPPGPPDGTGRA